MNKYDYFFIAGLSLWLLETAFFGWNRATQSVPEDMLNQISLIFMAIGAIGSIVRSAAAKVTINIKGDTTIETL
jgi:hypothetical protein